MRNRRRLCLEPHGFFLRAACAFAMFARPAATFAALRLCPPLRPHADSAGLISFGRRFVIRRMTIPVTSPVNPRLHASGLYVTPGALSTNART